MRQFRATEIARRKISAAKHRAASFRDHSALDGVYFLATGVDALERSQFIVNLFRIVTEARSCIVQCYFREDSPFTWSHCLDSLKLSLNGLG